MSESVDIEIRAKALLGEAQKQIQAFLNEIDTGAKKSATSASGLSSALSTAAGTLSGFLSAQAIMGGVSAAFGFAKTAVFGMNATLETATLQFATLMGDSDKAKNHVRDLFEIAKKTPFETGPIIEASRMLQTFGGTALNSKANIMLLGDAAAATGAPINELGFWTGRLYSMLQAGKPFGEASMRLSELAVMSPKARIEMENLQKAGGSAQDVFKIFTESLGRFGGAMEAQAATWQGVTSTFSDTINILLADSFKPFFEVVRDGLGAINTALGSDGAGRAMDAFKTKVQGVFGTDTRGTIVAVGNAVIELGQVVLITVAIANRAWDVLKVGIYGVASVVDLVMLAFSKLGEVIVNVAAKIPGMGKEWADSRDEMRLQSLALAASQKAFHDQAEAALEGVKGNDAFSKGIDAMRDGLADAKEGLANLKVEHHDAGAAAHAHGVGTDDATTAMAKGSKEAEGFGKKLHELSANLALGLKTLNDKDFAKEFGAKLEDARRDMERFGVTGKAVPEAVREALERLTHIKLAEWMKDNAEDLVKANKKILVDMQKDADKAGLDALKGVQDNLKAQEKAEADAADRRAKLTLSDYDYKVYTIRREAEAAQKGLDDQRSGYEEAMAAIADSTRTKMEEAARDHAAACRSMERDAFSMKSAWMSTLNDIPNLVKSAFTGGGGMAGAMKAITSELGSGLMKNVFSSGAFQPVVKGIADHFGQSVGTAFGMALPGIGSAIGAVAGPLLGKLAGAIGNLFGGAGAKLNGERDSWVEQLVGIKDLPKAQAALAKLVADVTKDAGEASALLLQLNSRNADTFHQAQAHLAELSASHKAALADESAATDARQQKQDLLNSAVERYGFTIAELGPTMQKQKLSEQAEGLINDFTLLTGAGINAHTVIDKMGSSINDFVIKAMRTGTEVPSAMRPMIEEMIKQGKLTDENGNKIKDLTTSGITFGETLTQGFKHVIDKLDELISKLTGTSPDTLEGGVAAAADSAADHIDGVGSAYDRVREQIAAAPIVVSVDDSQVRAAQATLNDLRARGFNGGSAGEGTSEGKGESHILDGMSAADAKATWLAEIASKGSKDQDWDRVKGEYGFKGSASGGVYARPTMRVIAETKPEIVGEASTIVDALVEAMRRVGGPMAGGGNGAAPQTICVYIGDKKIEEIVVDHANNGLANGRIRVPQRGVVKRYA